MSVTNKLILGTVQFGLDYGINNSIGKPSNNSINSILDYAYENNVKILDTAESYGDSQLKIGQYHSNSSNKFKVITKFDSSNIPKYISANIYRDLDQLNINELYCYMFHSFSDYDKYFHKYKNELIDLKDKGIIHKIGVSLHSNTEAFEVMKNNQIALIQLPFNLLDNWNHRKDVLSYAKLNGFEIHTRSVFLQGLFFQEKLDFRFNSLFDSLDKIRRIIKGECDIDVAALLYAYNQNLINKIIVGVDSLDHLKNNCYSLKLEMSNEIMSRLNEVKVENTKLLNPATW